MLLSDVCWDCLVCGTHFWTVTNRFQSSFLPQTVLDSCKGSSRAVFRGNHRAREQPEWPDVLQGHCCRTSCTGVWVLSSVVTLEADEGRSRALHCTQSSHTEAPSALLPHFLQLQGTDSTHSVAFWYFVSGLMCANWNFHSVLFCQTLLLSCQMSCF